MPPPAAIRNTVLAAPTAISRSDAIISPEGTMSSRRKASLHLAATATIAAALLLCCDGPGDPVEI